MFKYFLPYDVFERHKKVGTFIKNNETVVDIGGELNHLIQFCSPTKIIVANLKSGDIIIAKDKFPFKRNSFDVACAIDVLEHIPKKRRKKFVENLFNIASKKIILSFPVGTKRHRIYEREIHVWLKRRGESIVYLNEHIKYGLPTKNEIEELIKGYKAELNYSGNIFINKVLFKIFMFNPKIKFTGKIIHFLKLLFNLITNNFFYLLITNRGYSEVVNRVYVVIEK